MGVKVRGFYVNNYFTVINFKDIVLNCNRFTKLRDWSVTTYKLRAFIVMFLFFFTVNINYAMEKKAAGFG